MADLKEVTISTRVPRETATQVDQLARALNRNRSWLLAEALHVYLAREMQYLAAVHDGMEAYTRGDIVDHADVVAMFSDTSAQPQLQSQPQLQAGV